MYTSKQICEKLQITRATLMKMRQSDQIKSVKVSPGKWLYVPFGEELHQELRSNRIYARVSTTNQVDDLRRQISVIREYMAAKGEIPNIVYEDIASGMNYKRNGFWKLMHDVMSDQVNRIYISYKDRLARFGFEFIEELCSLHGTEIVILNSTQEEDFQTELTEDLVSIIHHFSMKMYSNRRKALKNCIKELS